MSTTLYWRLLRCVCKLSVSHLPRQLGPTHSGGLHGDAPHSALWGIPVVVLPHVKRIRQDPRSKGTYLCSLGSLDLKSHSKKLLTSNLSCMMGIRNTIYYKGLHRLFQHVLCPWYKWWPEPLGLIPLIIHHDVLSAKNTNLYPAPLPPRDGGTVPLKDPKYCPDNGYGTDKYNPAAASEGAPIGRNCPAVAKHLRNTTGYPDVQLVAVSGYPCLSPYPRKGFSLTIHSSTQQRLLAARLFQASR